MIRNVSVPRGISTRDQPNIFWVDLDDLDFNAGAPVRRLGLDDKIYAGNVAKEFKPAEPFAFLPAAAWTPA